MRFLIQIPQLIFGGAEKVLVNFANHLVSEGHQVEVLETYERGLLKEQFDERVTFSAIFTAEYAKKHYATPAEVKRNPLRLINWLSGKLVGYQRHGEHLAAKRFAGWEYDVAINYLELEDPAFLLTHIQAKKYLQWIHIDVENLDDPGQYDHFAPLWQRMDGIVCVSQVALDSFCRRYPDLTGKTSLIYNFYDTQDVLRKGAEYYRFEGDRPALLSVGRMTEQKKYLRFLDVLARLRDDGFAFSWHVLGDGVQRTEIEAKICEKNLSERVFLHGLTDNPYKYMKNCDLFVLPSGWEGFPTVTVEAKLLDCSVLATDVAGIREQLHHGQTGWIVDNDEEAIYEGLKQLLQDASLRDTLRSSEGMDRVCDNNQKYHLFMELC